MDRYQQAAFAILVGGTVANATESGGNMKLLTTGYLDYRAPGNGLRLGRAWLRLYVGPGSYDNEHDQHRARAVAVVTELNTNPGPSVTNAAGRVREAIEKVLYVYGFDMAAVDLTVYEHYSDLISYGLPGRADTDRYALHDLTASGAIEFSHADRPTILAAVCSAVRSGEEVPAGLEPIPMHLVTEQTAARV